jgi:hypothetical protein
MSVEVGLVILAIVIGLQLVPGPLAGDDRRSSLPPSGASPTPPGLRWGSSARLWQGGSRP